MSTRANIIIRCGNENVILYHHHNGMPKYLGAELEAFTCFIKDKFMDVESIANELVKKGITYLDNETGEILKDDEFMIATSLSTDIAYLYVFNIDEEDNKNVYSVSCMHVNVNYGLVPGTYVFTEQYVEKIPKRNLIVFEE